jgi:hypothetical protein
VNALEGAVDHDRAHGRQRKYRRALLCLISLLSEDDVDPVVVRVVGIIWEDVRAAIGINPVTAGRGARRGRQQPIGMGVCEVVAVGRILSGVGVVRSDVGGVCCDADRGSKIDLLPPARRLVGEGGVGEQVACGAPQGADMRAGVLRPLIEANAGDRAIGRSLELDPEINSARVAYRHDAGCVAGAKQARSRP